VTGDPLTPLAAHPSFYQVAVELSRALPDE
jgi:hypothetical protein